MLRTPSKIVLVLAALILLLVALLTLGLPRLIDSEGFRTRLHARAAEALGSPVEWTALEAGLLPPRLVLEAPELLYRRAGTGDTQLAAESVELRLSLRELLRGRIEIDSWRLHGVDLIVTRAEAGFVPAAAPSERSSPSASASAIQPSDANGGRTPVEWRFEDVHLEARRRGGTEPIEVVASARLQAGGRMRIEARVVDTGAVDASTAFDAVDLAFFEPMLPAGTKIQGALTGHLDLRMAAETAIERVDAALRVDSGRVVRAAVDVAGEVSLVASQHGSGPTKIGLGVRLADGGRLDLKGTTTRDLVLDLEGGLERFDLGLVAPFLPDARMEVAGLATGELRVVGSARSPALVELDVGVEDGRLHIPEYAVDGPFRLVLAIREPLSKRPHGEIKLDLTGARVRYGDRFEKRVGRHAEMRGRFGPDETGAVVFESRIRLREIDEILRHGDG